MDQHYSNLELTIFDEYARAPEYDHDATAFELDTSALAPQVIPDSAPEVFYHTSLPEAYHRIEETAKEPGPIYHTSKRSLKRLVAIIAFVMATAVAIGVGVGTWRRRKHSPYNSSSIFNDTHPILNDTHPTLNDTHPILNHTSSVALGPILNDTSLAALALANGNRYLFFQDNTGLIRAAIRTPSNGRWSTSTSTNFNVTSSAVVVSEEDPQIRLYYVSESHVLNSNRGSIDSWMTDGDLGKYTTAKDTRSLSVISIPNSTINLAFILYENPNGEVSALLQRAISRNDEECNQYVDITSQKSDSLPNEFRKVAPSGFSTTLNEIDINATLSTPFASASLPSAGTFAVFNSPPVTLGSDWPDPFWKQTSCVLQSSGPVYFTQINSSGSKDMHRSSYTSRLQSDIALFSQGVAIWINGTQPVTTWAGYRMPRNTFPFARLARTTLVDGSWSFLYHQMNSTTIAEEQRDESLKDWVSTEYITISDS